MSLASIKETWKEVHLFETMMERKRFYPCCASRLPPWQKRHSGWLLFQKLVATRILTNFSKRNKPPGWKRKFVDNNTRQWLMPCHRLPRGHFHHSTLLNNPLHCEAIIDNHRDRDWHPPIKPNPKSRMPKESMHSPPGPIHTPNRCIVKLLLRI